MAKAVWAEKRRIAKIEGKHQQDMYGEEREEEESIYVELNYANKW